MNVNLCVLWLKLQTVHESITVSTSAVLSLFCLTVLTHQHTELLSCCPAAIQRVLPRTPTTAHCPRPGGKSWPRSDRGSWPMQCITFGRRVKTSLLSDIFTLGSGRAVRNTTTVSAACPVESVTVALVVLRNLFDIWLLRVSSISISLLSGEKCRSFIELTPGETQGEGWKTHIHMHTFINITERSVLL